MTSGTEGVHLFSDALGGGFSGWAEVISWVELVWLFSEDLSDSTGHGHTGVGVDVDLSDTVSDTFLDGFDWDTDGIVHLSAILVDGVL